VYFGINRECLSSDIYALCFCFTFLRSFAMRVRNFVFVAMVAMLLAAQAQASTINFAGSVSGDEVTAWRSSSIEKTMDLDGDGVYGTLGAVNWNSDSSPTSRSVGIQSSTTSTTLGWAYVGSSKGLWNGSNYNPVDNVPSGSAGPGIIFGSSGLGDIPATATFALTGVAADYSGKAVRIGIMQDVLASSEWADDFNKTLTLLQVDSSGNTLASSATVSLRNGAAGDGVREMYFFDITGVNPGELYKIVTNTGNGKQAGYIGPMSIDIATAVPEPGTLALLAGGLFGLIAYAWRKRK
jgi:hypothetical protein